MHGGDLAGLTNGLLDLLLGLQIVKVSGVRSVDIHGGTRNGVESSGVRHVTFLKSLESLQDVSPCLVN